MVTDGALAGFAHVDSSTHPEFAVLETSTAGRSWATHEIAFDDWNLDGQLDAYLAMTQNTKNKLFLSDGAGTLVEGAPEAFAPVVDSSGGSTNALTTGDWNNDGILDIFTANFNGHNQVYHTVATDGGGFVRFLSGRFNGESGRDPKGIAAADFNGDGVVDFFQADGGIFENDLFLSTMDCKQFNCQPGGSEIRSYTFVNEKPLAQCTAGCGCDSFGAMFQDKRESRNVLASDWNGARQPRPHAS